MDLRMFETQMTRLIPSFAGFTDFVPSIPKIYWNVKSQEQRILGICKMLDKVICYADMLGENVDEIAKALKDIQEGKLDEMITAAIVAWFDENQPDIMNDIDNLQDAVESLNDTVDDISDDVDTLKDDVLTINGDIDTLQGDVGDLQTGLESANDRIADLEQSNYSYTGWGGWEVLLNNTAFSAGRPVVRTIEESHEFDSMPAGMHYSEILKCPAPMPFSGCNVAGSTDRNMQSIVTVNPHNSCGIDFRVVTPFDYTPPITTRARLVINGSIKQAPLNPTPAYNAVIGQQIANIADTYYQAMLNGREFSYGRNFFYRSIPDDIINDSNGRGRMECDTFVGMCLRGIPYEVSPYTVTTADYTYRYEDLYQDVSGATQWAANTVYALDDLIYINDYYYYKCIQAHTSSSSFNEAYWQHVWITNPYGIAWATAMNDAMHPENPYLQRDILYAGDYSFLGWDQERVFRDPEQALTGDIAFWVRRAKTPTYWGGTKQSPEFDNVGHVGILLIENGAKYIYHVTSESVFEHTVVNKTPIEEFYLEQPSYYYRPLYS